MSTDWLAMNDGDFLDELITQYDLPSLDGIALFYGEDTFEYKDCSIEPHERLSQNRRVEEQEVIEKAKRAASRKYFSLDPQDIAQEIELKLFIEEQKQGYRFTKHPQIMTICMNAATDLYRREARWREKIDLVASRFPPLDISYQQLLELHRKNEDRRGK